MMTYTAVSENNLEAQLFFKASGFRAVKIVRNEFDDGQDGYRFVWKGNANG